jgi:4-cresol dehydrogenase (hydroxylating)
MNRIREINAGGLYAVVEPGVTQGQLCDRLLEEQHPLIVNVTGSGRDTSLIGNALDRGVGYFSSRADALSGLEVVLGDGRVIRTGFGRFDHARTVHLYRHGLGPDLDGLFAQGNFGIVTAAGFSLMPRHEAHASFVARIDGEEALAPLVDRLVALRRAGVLQAVTHIGNRARTVITLAPIIEEQMAAFGVADPSHRRAMAEAWIEAEGFGPWSAVGGVSGPPALVRAARGEIRRALRGVARVIFLTPRLVDTAQRLLRLTTFVPPLRRKLALLRASEPLHRLTRGIPSDEPLKSVYWPLGRTAPTNDLDPDQSDCGILYALPILPADGAAVREAMDVTDLIFRRRGFIPYTTVNVMDERAMEGVITLAFPRVDTERTDAAHACIAEVEDTLTQRGWPPYRIGIHSMPRFVRREDPFWSAVLDIKHALDPCGVIAPGRYNPD